MDEDKWLLRSRSTVNPIVAAAATANSLEGDECLRLFPFIYGDGCDRGWDAFDDDDKSIFCLVLYILFRYRLISELSRG